MIHRWLGKLTGLEGEDAVDTTTAFSLFFCLLSSYYIIQPLRDEIGLLIGKDETPRLFILSMLVMLVANPVFGALLNRSGRIAVVTWIYRFFNFNLVVFFVLFKYLEATGQIADHGQSQGVAGLALWTATAFFVWVGVFAIISTSVFWALMADIYSGEQSKRVFGLLGAGGTAGQLFGSLLTLLLVQAFPRSSPTDLLLVDIILMEAAVRFLLRLRERARRVAPSTRVGAGQPKPSAFSGAVDVVKSPYLLAICLYLFLYSFSSTFLYFQKQVIVGTEVVGRSERVGYFSNVNIGVAVLSLLIQLFVTGNFLTVIGLSAGLSLVPLVGLVGFTALVLSPALGTVFWLEVVRRTANFAISQPSREVLFTAVSQREKYLAKNFMDTVVYRLGDSGAAFLSRSMMAHGQSAHTMGRVAILASVVFLLNGVGLGRAYARRMAANQDRSPAEGQGTPTDPDS